MEIKLITNIRIIEILAQWFVFTINMIKKQDYWIWIHSKYLIVFLKEIQIQRNGASFELINCKFNDVLSPGSHYIDEFSLSKNSIFIFMIEEYSKQ